jgi:hypothetical protein
LGILDCGCTPNQFLACRCGIWGWLIFLRQFLPFTWITLLFGSGLDDTPSEKNMGWIHAIAGILASYVTVTLNFTVQMVGLLKGNPKKFEVICKE